MRYVLAIGLALLLTPLFAQETPQVSQQILTEKKDDKTITITLVTTEKKEIALAEVQKQLDTLIVQREQVIKNLDGQIAGLKKVIADATMQGVKTEVKLEEKK